MAQAATTLNGGINAVVSTATVRDVVGFATSAESDDLVQIDSEYLLVAGGLGTISWTSITRGYAGSTAAIHADGATVYRLERGYTDASRLQVMSKAPTADYSYLRQCASKSNSWLNGEVGRLIGPSTDTIRTFDVDYSCSHLDIPGGLRSFSKCEIKTNSASLSWIDITTDVLARPLSWDRVDGMEADRLQITDYPTLGYRNFFPGYAVGRVTGVFGPATPPTALSAIADSVGWELYQARAAGSGSIQGGESFEVVLRRVLTAADYATILLYRGVNPSAYAMPAF